MTALGLLFVACAAAGGENRLWFVELELRGASTELRLDCGAEGETRIVGPFASTEERRLVVPVPVRSPLGAAELGAVPLPRVELFPAGTTGTARVLGWSAQQPAARLEALGGALSALASPPAPTRAPVAEPVELLLVVAGGAGLFALRRRPAACCVLALGVGGLALSLARSRRVTAPEVRVLAWQAGDELALARQASVDHIALPRDGLAVLPAGHSIEFTCGASGDGGTASATGARLIALEGVPAPALSVGRNGGEALLEVWTRTPAGVWRSHGPWSAGAPLGAALDPSTARPDPPGWLASGLPPGRAILLARVAGGTWLCCLGFELE